MFITRSFGEDGYIANAATLGFTEEAFEELVAQVARETEVLLEVVNYNVEGQQYVCAGHVSLLSPSYHPVFARKTQNKDSSFALYGSLAKRAMPCIVQAPHRSQRKLRSLRLSALSFSAVLPPLPPSLSNVARQRSRSAASMCLFIRNTSVAALTLIGRYWKRKLWRGA